MPPQLAKPLSSKFAVSTGRNDSAEHLGAIFSGKSKEASTMQRYEYNDAKSSKFWEAEVSGSDLAVRFGKIGTAGQTQTKSFAGAAQAQAQFDKLVREKTGKGYVAVETNSPDVAPSPTPAPTPTVTVAADMPTEIEPPDWTGSAFWTNERKCWVLPRRGLCSSRDSLGLMALEAIWLRRPKIDNNFSFNAPPVTNIDAWLAPIADIDPGLAAHIRAANPQRKTAWIQLVISRCQGDLPQHPLPPEYDLWMSILFASNKVDVFWLAHYWIELGGIQHAVQCYLLALNSGYSCLNQMTRRLQFLIANLQSTDYSALLATVGAFRETLSLTGRLHLDLLFLDQWPWAEADVALALDSRLEVEAFCPLMGVIRDSALTKRFLAVMAKKPYSPWPWIALESYAGHGNAAVDVVEFCLSREKGGERGIIDILQAMATVPAVLALLRKIEHNAASQAINELIESQREVVAQACRRLTGKVHPKLESLRKMFSLVKRPSVNDADETDLPDCLRTVNRKADAKKPSVKLTLLPTPIRFLRPDDGYLHFVLIEVAWALHQYRKTSIVPTDVKPVTRDHIQAALTQNARDRYRARSHLNNYWEYQSVVQVLLDAGPKAVLAKITSPSLQEFAWALLSHCDSSETAQAAADAYHRLKKAKPLAEQWLLKFPQTAALTLIPPALGKPGKERQAAEAALRLLQDKGLRALVDDAAAQYGATAQAEIAELLDQTTVFVEPRPIKLPTFWQPELWQPVLLSNGRSLPPPAVERLAQILAASTTDTPHPGLAEVRAACTADSLAAFAWDLFSAWLLHGGSAKDNWAMVALGWLGNDDTARQLAPLIRAWPGESAHARAVLGLDVLAAMGSDVALMHLNGIAEKVKFRALQDRARDKIAAIARRRGLSSAELADRLTPSLGLDARGELRLDYGPRLFTVRCDGNLKPLVRDANGKLLADLPKPNASDDAERAAAAQNQYKAFKKDLRTLARQQLIRLENAMVSRRRWTQPVFEACIAHHPLIQHIAQRLVWGLYPNQAPHLTAVFRIAEDGSYADHHDQLWLLPDYARIGLVHVLDLPADLATAMGQILGDYELVPPFPQLGRETYALTAEEQQSHQLTRYVGGGKIPTLKVFGLTDRGWVRGQPQDAGWIGWITKPLPGGLEAELQLDPGTVVGELNYEPEQTLGELQLQVAGSYGEKLRNFSEIDAVSASELLRDLALLQG